MVNLKEAFFNFVCAFADSFRGNASGLTWIHFLVLLAIILFIAFVVTSVMAFLKKRKTMSFWRKKFSTSSLDTLKFEEPEWKLEFSGKETTLFSSKIGGIPYWCVKNPTKPYPLGKSGKKMMLLAQINLSKEALGSPFPDKGLLQIFIDVASEKYGFDSDERVLSGGHKVVYHSKIDSSVTKSDIIALGGVPVSTDPNLSGSPLRNAEFSLSFHKHKACLKGSSHHLLGFPSFSRKDPRDEKGFYNGKKYDTVLFELHSEMYEDILWGNGGTGTFLINREDLMKKDFSNVLFNYE